MFSHPFWNVSNGFSSIGQSGRKNVFPCINIERLRGWECQSNLLLAEAGQRKQKCIYTKTAVKEREDEEGGRRESKRDQEPAGKAQHESTYSGAGFLSGRDAWTVQLQGQEHRYRSSILYSITIMVRLTCMSRHCRKRDIHPSHAGWSNGYMILQKSNERSILVFFNPHRRCFSMCCDTFMGNGVSKVVSSERY